MTENLDKIKLLWINFVYVMELKTLEDAPPHLLHVVNGHDIEQMKNALIYNGILTNKPTGTMTRVLSVSRKRVWRVKNSHIAKAT
jgi:hypothetical protein